MIIKGRARGGSSQLAAYLFDTKNERVTVLEISGTQREDLRGALREMEAVGLNATRSQQVLYHAQIAPARADTLTRAQFIGAVNRLGKALKLIDQPRAIVQHSYQGHDHLHVVWSRADVARSQVISNSWDRVQHHRLSRQLEQEWNLESVKSSFVIGDGNRRQKTPDTEHRQNTRLRQRAKETGQTFRERDIAKKEIAWCWSNSVNGQALAENLRLMGYTLALGDTGVIAVDEQSGAVYSVARCGGVTREEARVRCADVLHQIPKWEEVTRNQKVKQVNIPSRKAQSMPRNDGQSLGTGKEFTDNSKAANRRNNVHGFSR